MRKHKMALLVALGAGLLLGASVPSMAIANWSRKYNAPCSMCHRPAPPRLNFFGHQFRKMGYRLPNEVGQKPEAWRVNDLLSFRFRFRGEYVDPSVGDTTAQFRLNDVTAFFGGPITANLTGFLELERPDEPELEALANGQWNRGPVENYYALRWGQMHTLNRVGWAGFDRPTGISSPWLTTRRLVLDSPFVIGQDQRAVEYQHSTGPRGRFIVQLLNGLVPGASGSGLALIEGTDDTQKDVLAAWEQAFNDLGSGITLYGYLGSFETAGGPRDDLDRFALTGSWFFPDLLVKGHLTELQGGFGFGSDDVEGVSDTDGRGWYIDLEQFLAHESAVFARWDQTDPDRDIGGDAEHKLTIGGVRNVNDNLRMAVELASQRTFSAGTRTRSRSITVEAMMNF